ncbi:MAG: NupC/NupG family nucleoside CNT transporter [Flavobacteriales bacterium]|jgi:CNT family concentrative nucleoside transporter
MDILRALIGIVFLVGVGYLLSSDRKHIPWALVIKGIALQIVLALLILKVPFVEDLFDLIARAFVKVTSFAGNGVDFLLGTFVERTVDGAFMNFAFRVLPTVIFFSALMSLLYYIGVLQWVVKGFAWVMKHTLKVSGAESLAAAGNVFLGQTEAPLLVRPYLERMTKSEMLCLMTGGMATIAGGVMAAYIKFLGGGDPVKEILFAKHLLTASIMSAPAAIVSAKLLLPEKEEFNHSLDISRDKIGSNVLEAIANGTQDGLKLAVNVGAMLLVFTAFIYFLNYILFKAGSIGGLNDVIASNTPFSSLSFQMILGYLFSPVAWLIGVPGNDIMMVGQLLGEKTILNEFFAYTTLGEMKDSGRLLNEKSIIIATYALCGFSNFASIGIQIGGVGSLAPSRRALLSQLGVKALIGGTIACLFTAAIVGMFL